MACEGSRCPVSTVRERKSFAHLRVYHVIPLHICSFRVLSALSTWAISLVFSVWSDSLGVVGGGECPFAFTSWSSFVLVRFVFSSSLSSFPTSVHPSILPLLSSPPFKLFRFRVPFNSFILLFSSSLFLFFWIILFTPLHSTLRPLLSHSLCHEPGTPQVRNPPNTGTL